MTKKMTGDNIKINFGDPATFRDYEKASNKLFEVQEGLLNNLKYILEGKPQEIFLKRIKFLDDFIESHFEKLSCYYLYNPDYKKGCVFNNEERARLNIGIRKFVVLIDLFKYGFVGPLDFLGQNMEDFISEYISDLYDPGCCFFDSGNIYDEMLLEISKTLTLPKENIVSQKSRYFDIEKNAYKRFIFKDKDGVTLETPIEITTRTAYITLDNVYDVRFDDTHSYVTIKTKSEKCYPKQEWSLPTIDVYLTEIDGLEFDLLNYNKTNKLGDVTFKDFTLTEIFKKLFKTVPYRYK